MTKISTQEVKNIAYISRISLSDQEVEAFKEQLEQILTYAECVQECASEIEEPSVRNINVMRDDLVVSQNSELLLARAPERAGNFFVVPKILDN